MGCSGVQCIQNKRTALLWSEARGSGTLPLEGSLPRDPTTGQTQEKRARVWAMGVSRVEVLKLGWGTSKVGEA